MKLIIDIPEWYYKEVKEFKHPVLIDKSIMNGVPLDDVKAEMQKLADDPWNMSVGSVSQGIEDVIEILDNIGRK